MENGNSINYFDFNNPPNGEVNNIKNGSNNQQERLQKEYDKLIIKNRNLKKRQTELNKNIKCIKKQTDINKNRAKDLRGYITKLIRSGRILQNPKKKQPPIL